MGYDVRVVGDDFFIAKKNKAKALEALQDAIADHKREGKSLRWQIDPNDIIHAESLREALEPFGWGLDRDDDGNYNGIEYEQEKLGDDFYWHSLAPFIKAGSYIEMSGHGGEDRFRYYFDGKAFREQDAVMTWEDKD